MEHADFARLNDERAERCEALFANPRNSTAGSLKQQEPAVVAGRSLRFFAYSLDERGAPTATPSVWPTWCTKRGANGGRYVQSSAYRAGVLIRFV